MKTKILLGILVVAFGVTGIACADEGGTFTLTDIPSRFNGMYAVIWAYNGIDLVGGSSINGGNPTGVLISNGSVRIPMWIKGDGSRYFGNHTLEVEFEIYSSKTLGNWITEIVFSDENLITFSNGSARRSWNDGEW